MLYFSYEIRKGKEQMKIRSKSNKKILSAMTLIFSILSACIGFGTLKESVTLFEVRLLCGFCFITTPILVIAMINLMFQKENA